MTGGQRTGLRDRFPRTVRLKLQRLIRPLFDRHRQDVFSVRAGALLVRYRLVATQDLVAAEDAVQAAPLQIGFAVGRGIGSKPDRNRIKRLLRESFRLHQHGLVRLFADRPETLTLMVLYRGRTDGASLSIRRDLPDALQRIAADLTKRLGTEA